MVTVTEAGIVSVGPPGGPTLIRPRPGVMSMRMCGTLVPLVPKFVASHGNQGIVTTKVHPTGSPPRFTNTRKTDTPMKKLILGLAAAAAVAVAAPGLASAGGPSDNPTPNDAHGFARQPHPQRLQRRPQRHRVDPLRPDRQQISRQRRAPRVDPRATTPHQQQRLTYLSTCAPGSRSRGRRFERANPMRRYPPSTQQEDKSERCSVRGETEFRPDPIQPVGSVHAADSHKPLGLAIAVIAMVPAVFWASVAWFVWGWLSAVITATVVLVVSSFTLALVRSASGIETPVPAHPLPESRQAA